MSNRIGTRELGAEEKYLRRVVDPEQHDEEPASSPVRRCDSACSNVPADKRLADGEEESGHNSADPYVAPFQVSIRQHLVDSAEHHSDKHERNDGIDHCED